MASRRAGTFTRGTDVWWDDQWLKTGAKKAFASAARKTGDAARIKAPGSHIRRSITLSIGGRATDSSMVGILRARSPLAHLFELGVQPHTIAPSGVRSTRKGRTRLGRAGAIAFDPDSGSVVRGRRQAMKFPDGGFARGAVSHPGMRAQPFMRPSAALFVGFFNNEFRKVF